MSEQALIGSFSKVRRGASPRPIGAPKYFGGEVGWIRISDVTNSSKYLRKTEQYVSPLGESLSVRVNPGDLIMSICGTIGKPIIIDIPACIHDGFVQLYDIQNADIEYLYYLLQFHERDLGARGQPGTQVNLNTGIVEAFQVFFPSLPDQRKIAIILSTVDAVIEKTEQAIEKYRAIKQGMMHDLFTRGLDEKGKLRPRYEDAPHLYEKTELGWLPKEWKEVRIEQFASEEKNAIVDGPFGSNLKTIHYRAEGIPIIQSGFVTSNEFKADNYLYVTPEKFLSEIRSKVSPGDIVMAKIGAQCGTCAILPEDHPVGILAGNSLKITVAKNNSSMFLEAYLHYLYETGQIFLIISTTAQPAVNMSALKIYPMIRPEIDEQKMISERIAGLKSMIKTEEKNLNKYRNLKLGLMQDFLTGRKRVKIEEAA